MNVTTDKRTNSFLNRSRVMTAYWLGLLLIVVGMIMATPWQGRRVIVEESESGSRFIHSEGFRLTENFSPLWRPPAPEGSWGPEERWPGDPVVVKIVPRRPDRSITRISPDYIEISFYFCSGLLVLSGLAGGWQRLSQPKSRSVLSAVWSIFIGLCISAAAMILTAFGSMGFAPESLAVGIFASGIPLGMLHFGLQWLTATKDRRTHDPVSQTLATPRIRRGGAQRSGWMVPGTCVLLVAIALFTAWVEWFHPPVSLTYQSPSFGGGLSTETHYARQGLDSRFATREPMEIDPTILIIECVLVGGAVLAGFSALKRPTAEGAAHTASRMTGRAAMVLHASVWLLPLVEVGSDTISFLTMPFVAILLVPNLLSLVLVTRTSAFRRTGEMLPIGTARRRLVHHLTFAILWTAIFVISMAGFDFNNPMGGAVLGIVALWLSAISTWFLGLHVDAEERVIAETERLA